AWKANCFLLRSVRQNDSQYEWRLAVRRRCALIALAIVCCFPAVAAAAGAGGAPDLRALVTDASDTTEQIIAALRRRYSRVVVSSDPAAIAAQHGTGIVLTIGPGALEAALSARISAPIVSLFTSTQEFDRITGPAHRPDVTAIYAEASPVSQLRLISKLYGRPVSVAVLETPATAGSLALLRAAATAQNVTLTPISVAEGDNVLRVLARSAPFDVLLIRPDRGLYAKEGIRGILESTYRRRQGVIGFSTALVQAGILAASFANLDDTFDHLDEVINSIAQTGLVPPPQYPLYWRVAINDSVARSLGLVVDEAVRLLRTRPPGRSQ
ncbi:MAG: hypothetical protein WCF44_02195, partial [Candidatus Methylophosphatis roskildensis]